MAGEEIKTLKKLTNKKIILSYHNVESTPDLETLKQKIQAMNTCAPDVYKIALMPKSENDVHTIEKLADYFLATYPDKAFIFISMGELGKRTRITIPQK